MSVKRERIGYVGHVRGPWYRRPLMLRRMSAIARLDSGVVFHCMPVSGDWFFKIEYDADISDYLCAATGFVPPAEKAGADPARVQSDEPAQAIGSAQKSSS